MRRLTASRSWLATRFSRLAGIDPEVLCYGAWVSVWGRWFVWVVAEAKGISPVTVRNTISRVQDNLGLDSKQQLVIWAVKGGLVEDRESSD